LLHPSFDSSAMGSGGRDRRVDPAAPVAKLSAYPWFGAFLLHALLIPLWIASPLLPFAGLLLLTLGPLGWIPALLIFSLIAILNKVKFKYRPAVVEVIHNLMMGAYYERCELKGAIDKITTSGGLYCYHPHGILSVGYCANGVWSRQFQQLAGEGPPPAVTADGKGSGDGDGEWRGTCFLIADNLRRGLFSGFFKVLCDVTGRLDSATKENILSFMKQRRNIAIIPGGFQDATLYSHGKDRTAMSSRKGLFKYALQHGYSVYPIYTFGESETYTSFTPLLAFRLWLNKFDIPAVAFFGEAWMPLMPRRTARIMTYVGEPLALPKVAEPTAAQIEEWHSKYVAALTDVFESNKVAAGFPDAKLEVW